MLSPKLTVRPAGKLCAGGVLSVKSGAPPQLPRCFQPLFRPLLSWANMYIFLFTAKLPAKLMRTGTIRVLPGVPDVVTVPPLLIVHWLLDAVPQLPGVTEPGALA